MARKRQVIKIVVHKAEDMACVFEREAVQQFWTEKIAVAFERNGISKKDYEERLQA